ncbi:MAG TPA: hypothetical protein VGO47_11550 [Chlamydiales bacterium]|nr:hypothetical protein [Chlamydiales bacterium]
MAKATSSAPKARFVSRVPVLKAQGRRPRPLQVQQTAATATFVYRGPPVSRVSRKDLFAATRSPPCQVKQQRGF